MKHVTEHCINTNVVGSIVVSVEASWVNGINDWFVPLSLAKCDTRGLQTILPTMDECLNSSRQVAHMKLEVLN